MKIGMLEFSACPRFLTVAEHLASLIAAAQSAERLGLSHYWLTENQQVGDSWGTPSVFLSAIGARTSSIRIGSAGVLLRFHNPYTVACDYALLESLYPGRIDLGLARAQIQNLPNAAALTYGHELEFDSQLDNLRALFGLQPASSEISEVRIVPKPETLPRMILLGSSTVSSVRAAALGMPYAHALYFPHPDCSGVQYYRDNFVASQLLSVPYTIVAVAGLCSNDRERCETLARSVPEDTVRVVGNQSECFEQIERIIRKYQPDEMTFIHTTGDLSERLQSMAFVAKICQAVG